jgi:hypothetical protein
LIGVLVDMVSPFFEEGRSRALGLPACLFLTGSGIRWRVIPPVYGLASSSIEISSSLNFVEWGSNGKNKTDPAALPWG